MPSWRVDSGSFSLLRPRAAGYVAPPGYIRDRTGEDARVRPLRSTSFKTAGPGDDLDAPRGVPPGGQPPVPFRLDACPRGDPPGPRSFRPLSTGPRRPRSFDAPRWRNGGGVCRMGGKIRVSAAFRASTATAGGKGIERMEYSEQGGPLCCFQPHTSRETQEAESTKMDPPSTSRDRDDQGMDGPLPESHGPDPPGTPGRRKKIRVPVPRGPGRSGFA